MRDYDQHLKAQYGPDLDGEADQPDQADYDRLVIDLRDET